MLPKRVKIKPSTRFKRSFIKLPKNIQRLAVEKEAIFVKNPFEPQLRTHKLKGKLSGLWSFSLNYSYRIVFEFIRKDQVIFYDIGNHQIYR